MRKRVFVALVVAFIGYIVMQSQNDKNALPVLTLTDMEALAEGSEASNNWKCSGWWGTCKVHCGLCGMRIEGTGNLEGGHFCPKH